jgi:hypothetical protein
MDKKHTSEPWSQPYDDCRIEGDAEYSVNGSMTISMPYADTGIAEANVARIVACVNACAGMDDPAADIHELQMNGMTRNEADADIAAVTVNLQEVIDGLCTALETARGYALEYCCDDTSKPVMVNIDAAIAKAKGLLNG